MTDLGQESSLARASLAEYVERFPAVARHVAPQLPQLQVAPEEILCRFSALVQMVEDLVDQGVIPVQILLLHPPVDELDNVLVEVVDKVCEVGLVGVGIEAVPPDPVHVVLLVHPAMLLHLLDGQVVTEVGQILECFLVNFVVVHINESGCSLRVLEVDIVDASVIDNYMILKMN